VLSFPLGADEHRHLSHCAGKGRVPCRFDISAWNFHIDPPLSMLYDETSESRRGESRVKFEIELDREEDGRWIAEISSLPGVLAYGQSKQEAIAKVKALALRVLADEVEKEKQDKPLDISIACCP